MALAFICLKIFLCRIVDVSLATVRTIVIIKGKAVLSAIIALIEGLIWFLIVKEALTFDMAQGKLFVALAYSGGFAMGNLVGGLVSKRFIDSMVQVQIVTSKKDDSIILSIQDAGYAITVLDIAATKFSGEKYMLLSEIKHSHLADFKKIIYSLDEKAFIMVNETKYVYNGFFRKDL